MKGISIFCVWLISTTAVIAQSFDEKITTASRVRLNVTNVGTFGNAFRGYRDGSGNPSGEYPVGSGVEHLFESGIWIGASINGQQFVSTSAFDAPRGYSTGGSGFEFTAEQGANITERSSLFDSPFFTSEAVSHQDFICDFTESNIIVPGTQIQINNHTNPMFVDVHMEAYNWNFTFSDFFVILNMTIVNNGSFTMDSLYFGLWANTVVRNINVTPAGAGGSAFYSQGGNSYDDTLYLAYCWDRTGDVGFTDSYIGQKFLGAEYKGQFKYPGIDSNFRVHYNAWQFNNSNATYFFPRDDNERWDKLVNGLNFRPNWDPDIQDDLAVSGNRSDLISVGPFYNVEPGDSININYAFVMGRKADDGNLENNNSPEQRAILYQNADWAQVAYYGEDGNGNGILDEGEDIDGDNRITRYILPAPPNLPRMRVEARENALDIYWADNAESSIDPISQEQDFEGYRVYLSKLAFDVTGTADLDVDEELVKIAEYDIKGNDFFFDIGFESIRLEEPATFSGDTNLYVYRQTIDNILSGWQYAVAVTAFDRGDEVFDLASLESSPSANLVRVFPGTTANDDPDNNEPFVYPNPYYSGAAWEGQSNFQEESRKIIFANLPERCVIRVFTPAGDLIDEIDHNPGYTGSDIRWFRTFGAEDPSDNVIAGGEHAWDLLSKENQIISRGLYMFTVEDLKSGKFYKGKFLVIK